MLQFKEIGKCIVYISRSVATHSQTIWTQSKSAIQNVFKGSANEVACKSDDTTWT